MIITNQKQYIDFNVYGITKIRGSYGFRIILYYDNEENKVIQKSGYKTKKEANKERDNVLAELLKGSFVVNTHIKVKNYFTYWLEEIMRPEKLTSASYDSYKNVVYNHIIPKLGHLKLISLTRKHIQSFYKEKTEYSHSITKMCKVVIDTALRYALERKFISVNPAEDVPLPKCIKKRKYRTIEIDSKRTLNEEQIKLIITKSKETPIYLHVLFAVLMGLRKSEINALKYSNVDFVHRTLKIENQLGKLPNFDETQVKKGEYTKQLIPVKTFSSNRTLEIPDLLFEAILEERQKYERNRKRRINDKTTPFKDYDFICCSSYGNPRSKTFHFKYWKQLLKENNLPDITFHNLRTTYCTMLIKNNFNSKAISKQMGHATEIISVDVYGDNEEIISDCLEELEPFIEDVLPDKEESKEDTLFEIPEEYINSLVA